MESGGSRKPINLKYSFEKFEENLFKIHFWCAKYSFFSILVFTFVRFCNEETLSVWEHCSQNRDAFFFLKSYLLKNRESFHGRYQSILTHLIVFFPQFWIIFSLSHPSKNQCTQNFYLWISTLPIPHRKERNLSFLVYLFRIHTWKQSLVKWKTIKYSNFLMEHPNKYNKQKKVFPFSFNFWLVGNGKINVVKIA